MPTMPTLSPATTAVPTPKKTRKNVPTNSAMYFFICPSFIELTSIVEQALVPIRSRLNFCARASARTLVRLLSMAARGTARKEEPRGSDRGERKRCPGLARSFAEGARCVKSKTGQKSGPLPEAEGSNHGRKVQSLPGTSSRDRKGDTFSV